MNKTAAPGGPGAKVAIVKPAIVLKVVAKNLGDGDAASGDDSATDLNLNDPPGTCTVAVSDTIEVEVTVDDAAGPGTHRMCAQFTVDSTSPIAGGTGCKVVSRTSVAGACGVCAGGATTTTTTSPTSTTTTTAPPPPPLYPPCMVGLPAPLCDGTCPPGFMCIDPGDGCACVPSGGGSCGTVAGSPTCLGEVSVPQPGVR